MASLKNQLQFLAIDLKAGGSCIENCTSASSNIGKPTETPANWCGAHPPWADRIRPRCSASHRQVPVELIRRFRLGPDCVLRGFNLALAHVVQERLRKDLLVADSLDQVVFLNAARHGLRRLADAAGGPFRATGSLAYDGQPEQRAQKAIAQRGRAASASGQTTVAWRSELPPEKLITAIASKYSADTIATGFTSAVEGRGVPTSCQRAGRRMQPPWGYRRPECRA